MCSPYCFLESNLSTNLWYASELSSESNFLTSSLVGGRPVRSRLNRRMSVLLLASGEGEIPIDSIFFMTYKSIGSSLHFTLSTLGIFGCLGFSKAQNFSYFAPELIHVFINSFSLAFKSFLLASGGGITSSESSEIILCQISLSSIEPGLSAKTPSF